MVASLPKWTETKKVLSELFTTSIMIIKMILLVTGSVLTRFMVGLTGYGLVKSYRNRKFVVVLTPTGSEWVWLPSRKSAVPPEVLDEVFINSVGKNMVDEYGQRFTNPTIGLTPRDIFPEFRNIKHIMVKWYDMDGDEEREKIIELDDDIALALGQE